MFVVIALVASLPTERWCFFCLLAPSASTASYAAPASNMACTTEDAATCSDCSIDCCLSMLQQLHHADMAISRSC